MLIIQYNFRGVGQIPPHLAAAAAQNPAMVAVNQQAAVAAAAAAQQAAAQAAAVKQNAPRANYKFAAGIVTQLKLWP